MNFEFKDISLIDYQNDFTLPFSGKCGVWSDDKGDVIGLIKARGFDDAPLTNLYIDFFEVKIWNQGYGTLCIKDLFKRFETLERVDAESKESAEYFWESLGAFFINACDHCDDLPQCESNGYSCDNRVSSSFLLLREDVLPEEFY